MRINLSIAAVNGDLNLRYILTSLGRALGCEVVLGVAGIISKIGQLKESLSKILITLLSGNRYVCILAYSDNIGL